jgi:branched-chain amino acid transport system permease protein
MILLGNILIDTIAYGMVLFMISVGLSITLGLLRVVNIAHGAFAMAGGFVAAGLVQYGGLRYEFAVVAAVLVCAMAALPVEKLLISKIYGRDELDHVLLTIGLVFVSIAVVNIVFGSAVTSLSLPAYLSEPVNLGFRQLPVQRLVVVGLGLSTLAVLHYVIEKTSFGIFIRSAVDHPQAAQALGINIRAVYAAAFALGAGLAALGGIAGAELMPMEPYYALKYLVQILAVVTVGGSGNVRGTFAAALLLALIETTAKYVWPDLASILFYLTMLLVLSWRPNGLFGRNEK